MKTQSTILLGSLFAFFGVGIAPAATLTVTSTADSGPGTLRQLIADAMPGDRIEFAVSGSITIQNTLQPFVLNKALDIHGPGATILAIRTGQVYSRLFEVTAGPTIISGLTLSDGDMANFNLTDPEGAAIRNTAHLTLLECEITNNVSLNQGGAILNSGPSATLVAMGCTFAGNIAGNAYVFSPVDGAGGAIWSDGELRVTNCTFSDNYAPSYGGAVYSSGDAIITSTTITRNQAGSYGDGGGGIRNNGGTLALQNSIVSDNTNYYGYYDAQDIGGTITSGDYNLIQYTDGLVVPGTHNVLGMSALLGGLVTNGGPTRTHGLASISPALDAADCSASPAADQRGTARPAGMGCDIGAFEGALPPNHPPVLAHPIAPLNAVYGDDVMYTLPADTFDEPDAGQTLSYSVSGASFNPTTRTITAYFLQPGTTTLTVVATDDGAPPLSASTEIQIVVGKRPLTVRADDQCRPYGDPNPPLTITYFGLASDLSYLAQEPVASTAATAASPPGTYPIELSGGMSDYYEFVGLTNGTLTVLGFGVDYGVVRSFGFTNLMGTRPTAKVIEGSDGVLYGTTEDAIYRINRDGTDYRVLRSLTTRAPLREFSDGRLYGTTQYGGTSDYGTLFRLNKDGSDFTVLHNFTDEINDGSNPLTQLLEGSDGWIYGTARRVFKMRTDGTDYTIVHRFTLATDGFGLTAPLIEGADGALYGETSSYGPFDAGTVFKVEKNGDGFTVLHAFASASFFPYTDPQGLVEGSDGALYGAATPDYPDGIIFKLTKVGPDYSYSVLHTFTGYSFVRGTLVEHSGALFGVNYEGSLFRINMDGSGYGVVAPVGFGLGLTAGSDGKFYIVLAASADEGSILRINSDGTDPTVLWRFLPSGGDLYRPTTPLIEANNGRLYGAAQVYGPLIDYSAFSLNKDGSDPAVLALGANTSVMQASDGLLYGLHNREWVPSFITRANLDGSGATDLVSFDSTSGASGAALSSLNEGTDGRLYGVTAAGGTLYGGTVFAVNKDGTGFVVLKDFEDDFFNLVDPPAHSPQFVSEASDGKLYGICAFGGGVPGNFNVGSVFCLNRDGSGYANIHVFSAPDDVSVPIGRLIEGRDGRLYGTTYGGVFGLNKDGSGYAVLCRFPAHDQILPFGVTEGTDGLLYGFGQGYDPYPSPVITGCIYRLKRDGTEYCVLHRFNGADSARYGVPGEESFPVGWPLQASDGVFYGAAARGGASALGAIFHIAIRALNQFPSLDHAIPDQPATYGSALNFTLAANTFSDPDAGQTLSYLASGLPPGVQFDGPTRSFSGTPTATGDFIVTVTATDNGTPALETNTTFHLVVSTAELIVTAHNASRPSGQPNPSFTGTLAGVVDGDVLTAIFESPATELSPPGDYPITPTLLDPGNRLANYAITTHSGTLTITCGNSYVVTTTADSGPGSLRGAIDLANASCGPAPFLISFNIPGPGVQTIAPLTALPAITRPVAIDGYTQPGASPNTLAGGDNAVLLIQLTGTNVPSGAGLSLYGGSDGSLVRGLVVNGFAENVGISLLGSSSSVIAGNFIGTDPTGRTNLGNQFGVALQNSSFTLIGGNTPAARNIVSGSSVFGILYYGPCASNRIQGNFIGTDSTGTNALGNVNGVVLRGNMSGNLIGGTTAAERNIISGNSGYAIHVEDAPETTIQGNFIGTDVTGTRPVPNDAGGIFLNSGTNSLVGGTAAGARNLVSGNLGTGIGFTASGIVIQGNFIGVDVTGTNALGNGSYGIVAGLSATGNLIGGTTPAARNVISRNAQGIRIDSSSNNVIQGNYIGVDATGTNAAGNTGHGIYIGQLYAPNTLIGGTNAGAGNVISANGSDGINLNSPGCVIQGNIIGTDITGTNALFNGGSGIVIDSSGPFTEVGGTGAGARNVINAGYGIVTYSASNTVQGNYVGLGADGQARVGNFGDQGFGIIVTTYSYGNLIGGDTAGAGNVVCSQSGDGIRLNGSNNVVQGNFVGTDATGTLPRGSHFNGILILEHSGNLIGGLTPGACNLISGNGNGLTVSRSGATLNTIQGNFIGTDITGTNALPNDNSGLSLEDAPGNLVGGTVAGAGNVISGNGGYGVGLSYAGCVSNVVQGNFVGIGVDGTTPMPNYAGVRLVTGAHDNQIGGTAAGAGNFIAHNTRHGISVFTDGATNNALLGNSIHDNGWLGIDLNEDGMNANDPGDGDDGPNHFQNSPELLRARIGGGMLQIRYRVDSVPATAAYPLTIEFFIADANGAGRTLIQRTAYSTPQAITDVTFTPPVLPALTDRLVATATDANGNTSEFSAQAAPTVPNDVELNISSSGNSLTISWPSDALGFLLEWSTDLNPPIAWQPVTGGITINGPLKSYSVTIDANVPSRFYRLRWE